MSAAPEQSPAVFYWNRAAPGSYYLWDAPISVRGRRWLAKVSFVSQGQYDGVVRGDPDTRLRERCRPEGMMARVEREVCKLRPDAAFRREGF